MLDVPDIAADPEAWFRVCDMNGDGGLNTREVGFGSGGCAQTHRSVETGPFSDPLSPQVRSGWRGVRAGPTAPQIR